MARHRMSIGVASAFVLLLLLYNLFFMPTLGLSNSLAFHNIDNQEEQFPLIRVFGTIGWIAAGLFVSFGLRFMVGEGTLPEQTSMPLRTAAVHPQQDSRSCPSPA